jgi:hypothetical protein
MIADTSRSHTLPVRVLTVATTRAFQAFNRGRRFGPTCVRASSSKLAKSRNRVERTGCSLRRSKEEFGSSYRRWYISSDFSRRSILPAQLRISEVKGPYLLVLSTIRLSRMPIPAGKAPLYDRNRRQQGPARDPERCAHQEHSQLRIGTDVGSSSDPQKLSHSY